MQKGCEQNDKMTFKDFTRVIGLDGEAETVGDACGLSTLISMENDRYLEERQLDHESRHAHK